MSVQISLKSLKSAYPNGVVEEDQLNGWYHYVISAKKWKFVFDTMDQEKLNNIKSSFLFIH